MTREEIDQMAVELEEAGQLLNDETGEWWTALSGLVPRYRDSASDVFSAAVESEIEEQHRYLKAEFRVVEETYTATERRLVQESEE